MHANDNVAHELGISIDAARPGSATVSMTVTEEMTNGLDVCHGGILFTLADTAMAHASNAGNERAFSTTAAIEWIRPAHVGDRLTATSAVAADRGRSTVHDIVVTNERDEVVVLVRGQTLTVGGAVAPP